MRPKKIVPPCVTNMLNTSLCQLKLRLLFLAVFSGCFYFRRFRNERFCILLLGGVEAVFLEGVVYFFNDLSFFFIYYFLIRQCVQSIYLAA